MSDGGRLHVRNFPNEVKEWAQRRDLDLSKETRQMWHSRMQSTSPGHAALRTEIEELERLIELYEDRVDSLQEDLDSLRTREQRLYGDSSGDESAYEEWIESKYMLRPFENNPAILDAAERFNKLPETIAEDLRDEHPPDPNPLGLKTLRSTNGDT